MHKTISPIFLSTLLILPLCMMCMDEPEENNSLQKKASDPNVQVLLRTKYGERIRQNFASSQEQFDVANRAGQAADFLRQSFSGKTTPTTPSHSLSNSPTISPSHSGTHTPPNSIASVSDSSYGRDSASDDQKTLSDDANKKKFRESLEKILQQQKNAQDYETGRTSPRTNSPVATKTPIPFSPESPKKTNKIQTPDPAIDKPKIDKEVNSISPYAVATTFVVASSIIALLSYCDKLPEAMQNRIDDLMEYIMGLFRAAKIETNNPS